MIVYHGTTRDRARRIAREGLRPKPPSRRVWFAHSSAYAAQRARSQARRAKDRPVVLTCDIDVEQLRRRFGRGKVIANGSVISIRGNVPPESVRTRTGVANVPETPRQLAQWINSLLDVKAHRGAQPHHEGIQRLARWVDERLTAHPRANLGEREILERARAWLPTLFAGFEVDLQHLRTWRRTEVVPWEGGEEDATDADDPRALEALECLESSKAKRRQRGLWLLADSGDPDLFEWCRMMLEDAEAEVRVTALNVMRRCEEVESEDVREIAHNNDKRLRAAAIEVLALRGGMEAASWCWNGLTDPEVHVRLSAAKCLEHFDPKAYRDMFESALHDPHPHIALVARRLTAGQGFTSPNW